MTTYFVALDGHDEPTVWAREDEQLVPILRRCDVPYPHHWDELVARVIAGNPDAQEMSWREALRNPQDHDIEWGTPVDRRGMDAWQSTTEARYPIGTVFTAGTATFTKTDTGWIWERPDQPDVHGPQSDGAVSRLIDQGRIWKVDV